jgi:CRISPR-associated endonuclease/helicase Cas3
MSDQSSYFKCWGKADRQNPQRYHLLPYHCLDVAAVASVWWESSPSIRNAFLCPDNQNQDHLKAWALFFIALHDIGKFDLRFQRKAPHIWCLLQDSQKKSHLSKNDSLKYFHGPAGLFWLCLEFDEIVTGKKQESLFDDEDLFDFQEATSDKSDLWPTWQPWIEAVTGHHGHMVSAENNSTYRLPSDCPQEYQEQDRIARLDWIRQLEALFLQPLGISIQDPAPQLSSRTFLAGFCSVADWLGSANSEMRFTYLGEPSDLTNYFEQRHKDAREALAIAGLVGKVKPYGGVGSLLKNGCTPHQIQTIIDDLDSTAGMTLIEAPTGSGKTEAALAHAWQLLNSGKAESIIFALPTQATANAMLDRLGNLATLLFEGHPNLLLAHGSARYNEAFAMLRDRDHDKSFEGNEEEAWSQCSEWLAQSRKSAFLGQIGVCTIDQVLISVLPVRHRFIRSFGLGRSVLIVDEVHAYDTYMYGLLQAVLAEQNQANGSAVLLSATLPHHQRQALLETWGGQTGMKPVSEKPPYPLISQVFGTSQKQYQVSVDQMPKERRIFVEPVVATDCHPNDEIIQRMIQAAKQGAKVVLVCNLVDVAQKTFGEIKRTTTIPAMLFHSRFTLVDRQEKETTLLQWFGEKAVHSPGAILIATQVVEQSLDVDFDWMITQLCPGDLLFQRLGRLHRHPYKDNDRPVAFSEPRCTILMPNGLDFGYHGLIYANTRVMWRTAYKIEQLKGQPLVFPNAYREWIEEIYQESAWGNEPEEIEKQYEKFLDEHECVQKFAAQLMLNNARNMTPLVDDDQHITAVTRDGQMSLTVLPYLQSQNGRILRNGRCWKNLTSIKKPEALAMNKVSVPHSWSTVLEKHCPEEEGIYWLKMDETEEGWNTRIGPWELIYNNISGMERIK